MSGIAPHGVAREPLALAGVHVVGFAQRWILETNGTCKRCADAMEEDAMRSLDWVRSLDRVRSLAQVRSRDWVAVALMAGLVAGLGACTPPAEQDVDRPGMAGGDGESTAEADDRAGDHPGASAGAGLAADPDAPGKKTVQPPTPAEVAPPASPRLADLPSVDDLLKKTATHFEGHIGEHVYVQVDKPLYRPGETVWIKSWDLRVRDWKGGDQPDAVRYQLVSPKGAVVIEKRVAQQAGMAANDFEIPDGVQGGEYTVKVLAGVETGERTIVVSTYEPPRVKKKLEFVRKAYGAGDTVTATIEVKRPTGEVLANQALTAVIMLDGAELPRVKLVTNDEGGGLVRFDLPKQMERGDALLTVLVEDGGVTESVSKRVPIVLDKMQVSFFPEGGDLVQGLESRVYFEARNMIDKPADVEGRVLDDHGATVATFTSVRDGLGRFTFTPNTGRSYHAEITRPVGVKERYALPVPAEKGCVLRTFDDVDGQAEALAVAVRCAEAHKVVVTALQHDALLDAAAVEVGIDAPAIVYLKNADAAKQGAEGVARVTVFDASLSPVAERVVFRNRRNGLQVKVTPDQAAYVPREQVALSVTTTDAAGKPMAAELALSVVDDTVISFADDKKGHLLSKMLLEPEVPGTIEEPNFYFDLTEPKSAAAMEMLTGTRGWRRFDWETVKNPPPPPPPNDFGGLGLRGMGRGGGGMALEGAMGIQVGGAPKLRARFAAGAIPPPPAAPAPDPAPQAQPVAAAEPMRAEPAVAIEVPRKEAEAMPEMAKQAKRDDRAREDVQARRLARRPMGDDLVANAEEEADEPAMAGDAEWGEAQGKAQGRGVLNQLAIAPIAPVRVFPTPTYPLEYSGPRTDFRDTIYWAPAVRTGADGKATVTFHVSDAVTSFRVFAEGAGGGLLGRHEEVLTSTLPFSMDVKLPLAVSEGDTLELPLTLTNERDRGLPLSLTATFGELLSLQSPTALPEPMLPPKARRSLYYPLKVVGKQGRTQVRFAADAGGLTDAFERELTVEPLGFPQMTQAAGTLAPTGESLTVDIGDAEPGTAVSTLTLYPSPLATMTGGLAGLIREPSGCFEQTSSSNYPNVMVLQYLQSHDDADPALVARTTKLIDRGYNRLVGYETKDKGFEWFGSSPPHEALTSYGILQFLDMKAVYGGVDDGMLERTVAWLKKRRDGKGGFQQSAQALDSFGRASPEVTNAYITYAVAAAGLAGEFPGEVDAQAARAEATADPYVLALAANTLLAVPARRAAGEAATKRLAAMQDAEGAWTGANHSITRSGGDTLTIETTGLALLALMEADGHGDAVRKGVEWLDGHRSGFGNWGSTQSTILSLKALTTYAVKGRTTKFPGTVTVVVDGKEIARQDFAAGRREPIVFEGLGAHLRPGKNKVELRLAGEGSLPYSLAVEYRAKNPATHPDAAIGVSTALAKPQVKMGENVRLTATVSNLTDKGQPMTLARVGLPGGLTYQTWQLKELKDKKLIAFYETRAREVVLYFRDMKPSEVKEIPLDLVAMVPGKFMGPASSAYLYYTDDQKTWAEGVGVSVVR